MPLTTTRGARHGQSKPTQLAWAEQDDESIFTRRPRAGTRHKFEGLGQGDQEQLGKGSGGALSGTQPTPENVSSPLGAVKTSALGANHSCELLVA